MSLKGASMFTNTYATAMVLLGSLKRFVPNTKLYLLLKTRNHRTLSIKKRFDVETSSELLRHGLYLLLQHVDLALLDVKHVFEVVNFSVERSLLL